MKPIRFLGDSLKVIREFPEDVRQEIRIRDEAGTFRVIYTARLEDAVYVLHAFQKKTQATSRRDIETARRRLSELMGGR